MGKDCAYPEVRCFVPTSVIVGVSGGTHTVLVVFADEDSGEIPQLGLEFMSNGGEKKY